MFVLYTSATTAYYNPAAARCMFILNSRLSHLSTALHFVIQSCRPFVTLKFKDSVHNMPLQPSTLSSDNCPNTNSNTNTIQ